MYTQHPKIAIIDRNTLAAIGLKQILQNVMPIIEVEAFSSFEALLDNDVDSFFHYFVSMNVVLEHRQFFLDKNKKTIVLASSDSPENKLSDFHCISINVSEDRKSTRLNSSHQIISYAGFCLKKKKWGCGVGVGRWDGEDWWKGWGGWRRW